MLYTFHGYKCSRCGTEEAPNWITVIDSLDDNKYTIFCPQCYEKEAINGI